MRLRLAIALVFLAACQTNEARPSPSPPADGALPSVPVASASPTAQPSPTLRTAFLQRGPGASFGLRLAGADEPFVSFDTDIPGIVSPDGRRLAYFVRDQGDYRQSLQVFDGITGEVRELARLQSESPSGYGWSEDSAGIAYGVRSDRFETGGVDPPPTYTAVRLVELANPAPREVARVRNENLVVLGWRRADRIVLARSGWAEGASRPVSVREDGAITRSAAGESVSPQSLVPSPDRTVVAGSYWSGSSDPVDPRRMINHSGVVTWSGASAAVLATRMTDVEHAVSAFAYRPNSTDLLVLVSGQRTGVPTTSLEVWPDHGRAPSRRIWTVDQLFSQGNEHGFFVTPDGVTAYVSFLYPGRVPQHFAIDVATGAAAAVSLPERHSFHRAMLVTDAAIARHRKPPVTSALTRADAIARIRALDRNLVRVDRIEAKLGSAAEVQRLVAYRTKLDMSPDAPVWVVAVAGDVRAFTDTESFRLSWGAWFLDGRDGRVIGFDGDPRPGWPWFWNDLRDRAP